MLPVDPSAAQDVYGARDHVLRDLDDAEVTLQAAVAVRDKVIQAYLDVIRMPI